MTDRYWKRFIGNVYARLGGLEMAEEFFERHPGARISMRRSCRYHFGKKGASYKGAKIFFERTLLPILQQDHAKAKKRPIPKRRGK